MIVFRWVKRSHKGSTGAGRRTDLLKFIEKQGIRVHARIRAINGTSRRRKNAAKLSSTSFDGCKETWKKPAVPRSEPRYLKRRGCGKLISLGCADRLKDFHISLPGTFHR